MLQSYLGENFTFEEFVKIVSENRQQRYWFGPSVEVPLIVVYVLIMSFGLFGNGLICYVIASRKKLRTVRNMFILNLAVSDIVMCVFCMPTTLIKLLLKNWPLGQALCSMVPWMQAVNVFVSTMTITAIAVDRYQVIVYQTTMKDGAKKCAAAVCILAIWVSSMLVALPLALYSKVVKQEYIHFVSYSMCLEEWPDLTTRSVYAGVVMLLQFVVPVLILITIHWRICNFLKCRIVFNPTTPMGINRAVKEAKRHRKNSTLLMTIAIMFALCWFPISLLNLLADFDYSIFMFKNFLLAFAVAHVVAMVSACLNPVVYGWFNSNFRREFTSIVCFWRDPHSSDKNKLMPIEERRQIIYTRRVSYKAIQCEIQPPMAHRDTLCTTTSSQTKVFECKSLP